MLLSFNYLSGSPGPSGFGSKSTAEHVTASLPPSFTAIITGNVTNFNFNFFRYHE